MICSDLEWRYGVASAIGDETGIAAARREAEFGEPIRIRVPGTFEDNMRPLESGGRVRRVRIDGAEVLQGIRFISTPGHSIDQASIGVASDGQLALFSSDVFHHPIEMHALLLESIFCKFPSAVGRSRRKFIEYAAGKNVKVFAAYFLPVLV